MQKYKIFFQFIIELLITVLLVVQISYMLRNYDRLMSFYGLDDKSVDVVIVGTSISFASFMPMEAWNLYGMAAYDYCTNVQFENSLDNSIREVLKTQDPMLIMVDIDPFVHGHYAGNKNWTERERDKYIQYNVESMKYSLNRHELISEINKDIEGGWRSFISYDFDILRNHRRELHVEQFNNTLYSVNYGYGYLERDPSAIEEELLLEDDGSEEELTQKEYEYLVDLIRFVRSLDCDVVFYCAPQVFKDQSAIGRKNYLGRVLEENGLVYWDFTKEMDAYNFDIKVDYWGYNHMDSLGAEKSTKLIANKIKENYIIPDRRNDENYNRYKDDFERWKVEKKEYNDYDMAVELIGD